MKQVFFLLMIFSVGTLRAQEMTTFKLYNPKEDAALKLSGVIRKAGESGKHVLVQIGGNWCVWCARFNDFLKDPQVDSTIQKNFLVYHLNYSNDNRNSDLLTKYDFPQRFGFPIFLILDGTGKRLHTQNSAYLEQGKGYNKKKVIEFLDHWSPGALDPLQYKKY